jgi:hypothetical protein
LSFLIDTSYCKEQSKMREDIARKKEEKKEEAGSGNLSLDRVNC